MAETSAKIVGEPNILEKCWLLKKVEYSSSNEKQNVKVSQWKFYISDGKKGMNFKIKIRNNAELLF
jgi:hypothetical protein